MQLFWRLFGAALICVAGALPASAGFKVCNNAALAQILSVAYHQDGDWVSEGWWTIQPETCKTLKGADLKVKYFYYRAMVKGGSFEGQNYMFCTDDKAYTINGNTDCSARGYGRESFSEVEIGSGITDYTLTLVDQSQPKTQPSAPQDQTGSQGEPFSVSGVFQGCDAEGDAYYCAFHAEGWKWYVYEGQGTSRAAMNQLKALRSGDLEDFSGDIKSFADVSVEAVVRSASKHGPRNENENMMEGLQGKWRNTDDPASVMIIYGGESFEYYGSELMEVNYLQFGDDCGDRSGIGPLMIKIVPGDPDPYCYAILGWDAISLQMSYVGGAGANDTYWEKYE